MWLSHVSFGNGRESFGCFCGEDRAYDLALCVGRRDKLRCERQFATGLGRVMVLFLRTLHSYMVRMKANHGSSKSSDRLCQSHRSVEV